MLVLTAARICSSVMVDMVAKEGRERGDSVEVLEDKVELAGRKTRSGRWRSVGEVASPAKEQKDEEGQGKEGKQATEKRREGAENLVKRTPKSRYNTEPSIQVVFGESHSVILAHATSDRRPREEREARKRRGEGGGRGGDGRRRRKRSVQWEGQEDAG
jgi:hypothetical protein